MQNKKIKLWKKILIIIFIVISVFVVLTARKIIIIKHLENKFQQYKDLTNYSIRTTRNSASGLYCEDIYVKNNKFKIKTNIMDLNDFTITRWVYFSEIQTNYILDNYGNIESEYVDSHEEGYIDGRELRTKIINPYMLYTAKSESNILIELLKTDIRTVKYNDKDCYYIHNSMANGMYIDKETGLVLYIENGYTILENGNKISEIYTYLYNFNDVTEDDMKIPDTSEKTIQQNN